MHPLLIRLKLLFIGLTWMVAGAAHGAISVEFSDDCARTGYSAAQRTYSHTDSLPNGWMVWDVYLQGGTNFFACTRRSHIIVEGDTTTAVVGTPIAYMGTTDAFRNYFRANDGWLRPSAVISASGACYTSARGLFNPWTVAGCVGNPAQRLYGWYLGDRPAAYVTYQVSSALPRVGTPPQHLMLPFRVVEAGSGGWLSIAYKGQEFWHQPLSSLTEGQWYQAEVPFALLNEADPVFTFYLQSTGARPASVFVPTESTLSVDSDRDGIVDGYDNCISTPNPSQRDSDHDGYGNRCDADLNQSGLVTSTDYMLMRTRLNTTDATADLNESGRVTIEDYTILRTQLNTPPGPSGQVP